MKTMYVIIAIALVIVTWVIIRITKHRSKRSSTLFDQLTQDPTFQLLQQLQNAMGTDATQQGMIPGGYGGFGYDVTNPIPVKGTIGEIAYLAMLRTENGIKVKYKRVGSTRAANINHPIDIYEIWGDVEHICKLHLCPYYKENSAIAPKGFEVISIYELFEK